MMEFDFPPAWDSFKGVCRIPRLQMLRDLWGQYAKAYPENTARKEAEPGKPAWPYPGDRMPFWNVSQFIGYSDHYLDDTLDKGVELSNYPFDGNPPITDYLSINQIQGQHLLAVYAYYIRCVMPDYFKIRVVRTTMTNNIYDPAECTVGNMPAGRFKIRYKYLRRSDTGNTLLYKEDTVNSAGGNIAFQIQTEPDWIRQSVSCGIYYRSNLNEEG